MLNLIPDVEAVILFRQALACSEQSPLRSIDLLNRVVALCECERGRGWRSDQTTHMAARIELIKLHQGMDQPDEALRHYKRAIELGANASRLLHEKIKT